ncbi:MAG: TRAP transporter small permease subunit [Proteobacteria bacterium]|nr:TRAP transporter small permease subunit [Pseudomonadota bacterium]
MKSLTTLDKFERFTRLISSWFEWVGLFGLLGVMFVTCIDVIGAKLLLRPVFGALDIVMLSQLVAISFAVSFALILGRHVRVEFFVAGLPTRAQTVIDSIVSLLGLTLFILIIWRLSVYGYSLQTSGEVSPTALIPLYPFAYGIALASIPVSLTFFLEFLKSLNRIVTK